ncbi:ubiquinone biosynthesis protein COQ9 [Sphingomonas vulcanisoli]|uniref:Ubiquinone biosynthesis protein COQ9 n=1 Tax=Sphingomonas vulcanisoli TaxID=1658060 RepID=A0ABX0TQ49_9SPHN|nr:COQ9 family protein [Sphingomonas vulcanisoli]NIJ06884.1 ubiquinone biosynthesis protein COQ9 [Sphingomonas vulcanisoli]
MTEPLDMTLDELRAALGPLLPGEAAFDGWSEEAAGAAARALGIPADRARLAFPDGAVGMIDAWFGSIDRAMAEALPPETLAAMKIRVRITALVRARLEAAAPHREALRRALAILALPTNAATGAKLGWRAADAMWRLAGDDATGLAHYTKRLTLAAVYGSTMLVFLDDESDGFSDTYAFLDRRIENVMQFEKFKARLKPDPDRHFSPARFLGRLRYPA